MAAFRLLTTCRPIGMGVGPISHRDVIWFAEHRLRYEPDVVDTFATVIHAMDGAYLKWEDERKPPDKPPPGKGAPKAKRRER